MTTRGIYTFVDGYEIYVNGLSTSEKRALIREHGRIVNFIPM